MQRRTHLINGLLHTAMHGEACRGNVPAAAEAASDGGHIGIVFRAKAASDAVLMLAKHAGDVDAGDGTQRVDDRLGIRFHGFETGEVRKRKVADGEPFPLMELRARDRLGFKLNGAKRAVL